MYSMSMFLVHISYQYIDKKFGYFDPAINKKESEYFAKLYIIGFIFWFAIGSLCNW